MSLIPISRTKPSRFSAEAHAMAHQFDPLGTTIVNLELAKIAIEEGFESIDALLEIDTFDSVCHGICCACLETTDSVEPDTENNICESCGDNEVKSSLILAGLI